MGFSRKKNRGVGREGGWGVEDMEFPRVLKKERVEFLGIN